MNQQETKEPLIWRSECGQYYARQAFDARDPSLGGDVISADFTKVWLRARYKPTGHDDGDIRFTHPEFTHEVLCWSNRGDYVRKGQRIDRFEQGFADLDTTQKIIPFKGNCILQSYTAEFRRLSHSKRIARLCAEAVEKALSETPTL